MEDILQEDLWRLAYTDFVSSEKNTLVALALTY